MEQGRVRNGRLEWSPPGAQNRLMPLDLRPRGTVAPLWAERRMGRDSRIRPRFARRRLSGAAGRVPDAE